VAGVKPRERFARNGASPMKISQFYESPPHQGLSEARGGKELFCIFSHQSTATTSLRGGNVHHNGEYRGSDPLIISGLSDFRGSGGKVIGPRPFLQSQKKSYFTKNEFIFQMHNPGEPLTRESGWDRACIVWAGFCKYCRCCY
jgi:hypothetical protein